MAGERQTNTSSSMAKWQANKEWVPSSVPMKRDELDSSDLETLQKETVDTVYFPRRVKQ